MPAIRRPIRAGAAAILLRGGRDYELTNSHSTELKAPLLEAANANAQ